jgi:hypothetical protein
MEKPIWKFDQGNINWRLSKYGRKMVRQIYADILLTIAPAMRVPVLFQLIPSPGCVSGLHSIDRAIFGQCGHLNISAYTYNNQIPKINEQSVFTLDGEEIQFQPIWLGLCTWQAYSDAEESLLSA